MTNGFAPQGRWRLILQLLLAAVLAWQLLGLASSAASRNLMFDGGMNLEVSKSIANGLGPRARYDAGVLYPAGVQSKEPFFLVGAAVFKVAGVGPVQAQMPNMLFLLLLAALIVRLIAHVSDLETGLLAAVLVMAMPRLHQYGLNGFGEIPTMFFGLAALAVIAWPDRLGRGVLARAFFAGTLGALAVATKVVGVVQLAAIALVLALRVWTEADAHGRIRALLRAGLAFAAGVAFPLVLIEAWRWRWLGSEGYGAYWDFQLDSIRKQSGATPRDPQAAPWEKVPLHFAVLVREFGRSALATLALLIAPLLAIAATAKAGPRTDGARRWVIVGLVVVACAYIPWWLAIVPTNKAWVRYLYIALLALALLSALAAMASARIALRGTARGPVRFGFAALAVGIGVLYGPFVARSLQALDFSPSHEVQATQHAAKLISSLPNDARVFGYGWYASPVIQLYSDRAFLDLSDWPIGTLIGKEAYIVADRAELQVQLTRRVLRRYPHRLLMRENTDAQLYAMDFAHPYDPFAGGDTSKIASLVDFQKDDYTLVYGYEPVDSTGGRFVESDSEILLRYDGQSVLELNAYSGLPQYYLYPERELNGRVIVGDCPPLPFRFNGPRWTTFRLPLGCRPAPGPVRVRLLFDNVQDMPFLYDRQRAGVVRRIGFTD